MDFPRSYGATDTHSAGLLSVQSDLQALSRNIGSIGGSADCVALRGNIRSLRCQVKRKISSEQSRLTNLLCGRSEVWLSSGMSEQQCIDLQQQLHSCVARLHQLMEEERSLIQRHPSPSSHAAEKERTRAGSTAVPLLHSVSQLSDQRLARAERDATDLEELERDIGDICDLHQIQEELASMVKAQGEMVDDIEYSSEYCVENVREGNKQLQHAVGYRTRRLKVCICLSVTIPIVIIVIVIIIVLAVVLPKQNN